MNDCLKRKALYVVNCVNSYSVEKQWQITRSEGLKYDRFVQLCVCIKRYRLDVSERMIFDILSDAFGIVEHLNYCKGINDGHIGEDLEDILKDFEKVTTVCEFDD